MVIHRFTILARVVLHRFIAKTVATGAFLVFLIRGTSSCMRCLWNKEEPKKQIVQEISQCRDPWHATSSGFLYWWRFIEGTELKDQKGFEYFSIRFIGWEYVIRLIILYDSCKDKKNIKWYSKFHIDWELPSHKSRLPYETRFKLKIWSEKHWRFLNRLQEEQVMILSGSCWSVSDKSECTYACLATSF